jgi:hypothetical protein
MNASAATLNYDYPPLIVAPVAQPQRERARFSFYIPPDASAATSDPMDNQAGFADHFAKLRKLAIEPSLWADWAEPPSAYALGWAHLIIQQLQSDDCRPTRVVASAEGGVGICFVDGIRYADIECLNSGTILGVTSDKSSRPVVWEIEQSARGLERASERIRKFILASKAKADAPGRTSRR